jgi:hypothetical protein
VTPRKNDSKTHAFISRYPCWCWHQGLMAVLPGIPILHGKIGRTVNPRERLSQLRTEKRQIYHYLSWMVPCPVTAAIEAGRTSFWMHRV